MALPQRLRELFSWKKWRPDVWTLLLIAAIAYVWFRPPAWVSEESRAAPELQVSLLDGRRLNLEQLRGKVVLVNFWATWCPYCRHEMPAMESFYRDYQGKGFEMLALSQDDDIGKVAAFMGKEAYHFPVALEPVGRCGSVWRGEPAADFIRDRQAGQDQEKDQRPGLLRPPQGLGRTLAGGIV